MTKKERRELQEKFDRERAEKALLKQEMPVKSVYIAPVIRKESTNKVIFDKEKDRFVPFVPLAEKFEATPQQIRDGVWQYLLDHSHFTAYGNLRISFTINSKESFWQRCEARIQGVYKRYDPVKIETKLQEPRETRGVYIGKESKEAQDRALQNKYITSNIDRNGSLIDKAKLWCYRKLRDNLFPRSNINGKKHTHVVLEQRKERMGTV